MKKKIIFCIVFFLMVIIGIVNLFLNFINVKYMMFIIAVLGIILTASDLNKTDEIGVYIFINIFYLGGLVLNYFGYVNFFAKWLHHLFYVFQLFIVFAFNDWTISKIIGKTIKFLLKYFSIYFMIGSFIVFLLKCADKSNFNSLTLIHWALVFQVFFTLTAFFYNNQSSLKMPLSFSKIFTILDLIIYLALKYLPFDNENFNIIAIYISLIFLLISVLIIIIFLIKIYIKKYRYVKSYWPVKKSKKEIEEDLLKYNSFECNNCWKKIKPTDIICPHCGNIINKNSCDNI